MSHEKPGEPANEYQTGGWKAHWILIVCSLLYMINYVDRTVLTVVVQPMKVELGLSDSDIGLLLTAFTLCIAIFSFPVAYLIDRWSRKKSIAVMAFIWSIFTYVTGLAKNFVGILIPRMLVGVGEAGFSAGGTAMITAAYKPQKHGMALGIFNVAISVGAALGTIIGGILSVKMGWRFPFFIFAVPGILLGICALFLKDYKTVKVSNSGSSGAGFFNSVAALLKIPTLRWFFVGYGMMLIMSQAQMAWTPALIMREFNVKEDVAGSIAGAGVVLAVIGAILGGWFTDFWHKRNRKSRMLLPAITALISAFLLAISALLLSVNWVIAAIIASFYGLIYFVGAPALSVVSQEVIHPSHKGLSWGLTVFCMYFLGGAWSPWATGSISDALGGGARGLQMAIAISCIGGLAAAFCFLMGSRSFISDADKVKGTVIESEK